MESESKISCLALLAVAAALAGGPAHSAQPAGPPQIFSCETNGKKLTSDRPIPECTGRDQRILNADGSVKRVVPPPPTADERAAAETAEREALAARAREQDAIRRDRNLMQRFPDEARHHLAREKALDDSRKSVRNSEARVALLNVERKKLLDEAEFYLGKPLPARLKFNLDANEASLSAQKALIQNQQDELVRINALYDAELDRLKKLWAGAKPGSLGAPPGPQAAATARIGVQ